MTQEIYKVFEIKNGSVRAGAGLVQIMVAPKKAESYKFLGIQLGQEGRGRFLQNVKVDDVDPQTVKEVTPSNFVKKPVAKIFYATIGTTKSGKLKFISVPQPAQEPKKCLVIDLTDIGFRGGNYRVTTEILNYTNNDSFSDKAYATTLTPEEWATILPPNMRGEWKPVYKEFAKERILAIGTIAQGNAGSMGEGEQMIYSLGEGENILVGRTGRLYGNPPQHIYFYKGGTLSCFTPEQLDLIED